MNSLSISDPPDRAGTYGAAPQRPYGIVIGIAISLLLHALLVLEFGGPRRPAPPEADKAVQPLTVWLAPAPKQAPKPAPIAAAIAAPAAPITAPLKALKKTRPPADTASRTTASKTIIALPAAAPTDNASTVHVAPNGSDPADPFAATAPAAAPAAPTKPGFDIEAARQVARKVASERDPAKVGTAVGQIPDRALKDQSDLARTIDSGKRRDCKDGVPGGLLAPLFLLMDKKDSGCKW